MNSNDEDDVPIEQIARGDSLEDFSDSISFPSMPPEDSDDGDDKRLHNCHSAPVSPLIQGALDHEDLMKKMIPRLIERNHTEGSPVNISKPPYSSDLSSPFLFDHESSYDNFTPYAMAGEIFNVPSYFTIPKLITSHVRYAICNIEDGRFGDNSEKRPSLFRLKKYKQVGSTITNIKKIIRHIKLLQHLDHEDILSLYDTLKTKSNDNDIYLMFPHMETHFGKLIKMKSLTSEHISYAIYQVFRGLKYIHSAGLIHANINPNNLLINGYDLKVKITGFDNCCFVPYNKDKLFKSNENGNWNPRGSDFYYCAPEILLSKEVYFSSDFWSVCIILCEIIHSKPFYNPDPRRRNTRVDTQLLNIFETFGTPSDLDLITNETEKNYITENHGLPTTPNICKTIPEADEIMIDILHQGLKIHHNKRSSIEEFLGHLFFKQYEKLKTSEIIAEPFTLDKLLIDSIQTTFGANHHMGEELKQASKNSRKKRHLDILAEGFLFTFFHYKCGVPPTQSCCWISTTKAYDNPKVQEYKESITGTRYTSSSDDVEFPDFGLPTIDPLLFASSSGSLRVVENSLGLEYEEEW